jgi:hypothetical protein
MNACTMHSAMTFAPRDPRQTLCQPRVHLATATPEIGITLQDKACSERAQTGLPSKPEEHGLADRALYTVAMGNP